MINLLPPLEKEKLYLDKKEKLSIIWGIIILSSLICFVLILLSIKFYILADTDYQKIALEKAQKEYQTAEFTDLSNQIKKYNQVLQRVDSFYKKEIYFGQSLKTITDVSEPKGLYLTSLSLARNASGIIQVNVSGQSDTRESLLAFRKSIESDQQIKSPYFSADSWISPKNVNFSLTFQIDGK